MVAWPTEPPVMATGSTPSNSYRNSCRSSHSKNSGSDMGLRTARFMPSILARIRKVFSPSATGRRGETGRPRRSGNIGEAEEDLPVPTISERNIQVVHSGPSAILRLLTVVLERPRGSAPWTSARSARRWILRGLWAFALRIRGRRVAVPSEFSWSKIFEDFLEDETQESAGDPAGAKAARSAGIRTT